MQSQSLKSLSADAMGEFGHCQFWRGAEAVAFLFSLAETPLLSLKFSVRGSLLISLSL